MSMQVTKQRTARPARIIELQAEIAASVYAIEEINGQGVISQETTNTPLNLCPAHLADATIRTADFLRHNAEQCWQLSTTCDVCAANSDKMFGEAV